MGTSGEATTTGAETFGSVSLSQFDNIEDGLVSVLTPVYNGESYVCRLLDSILKQTYANIEMILVDDGSTDNTVQKAEKYASLFKKRGYSFTIIQTTHRHASAAINVGLPHVKGKYLVWPDSDDELCPNSIKARVRFLESHPGYHCVRSIMKYVSSETGKVLQANEKIGDLREESIFWDVLEGRSFVCCGCYMLETKSFFQIYPSKKIPEYEAGQNFQMLLPFLFYHKCPTIPEKLYQVNLRADSHSRSARSEREQKRRLHDFECMLDDILKICGVEHDPQTVNRIRLWKLNQRKSFAYKYHHLTKFNWYRLLIKYLRLKQNLLQHRTRGFG